MRGQYRAATVGIVLALVAVACDGGGGENKPAPSSASPRQELRVGTVADQFIVSGPRANVGWNLNIYDTLVGIDAQYGINPLLAERWELRPPHTWRFFLRRGASFNDGQAVNAQTVKTGLFDRIARTPGGGTIKAGLDSAVVVDDYTIDFTPTSPNLLVPQQIGHPMNFVAAPNSDPGTKPVGSGPFRFVEYQSKGHLTVERNPSYWGPMAKLDRITFRFIPDSNVRRLALESGDVDLISNVPTGEVRPLKNAGFTVATSAVGAYDALYLNIRGEPPYDLLRDRDLRLAIASSIDRRAIANGVLDGQATPDATMVPPAVLGPHASLVKGHPFDPGRARSMLDAAGWRPGPDGIRQKEGRRLTLQLVSGLPSAEILRPLPEYVQSELKRVGIDVEIIERPDTASYDAVLNKGEGDIFIEQGNQNDANSSFLPILLFCNCGSGESPGYVSRFAPGPEFDMLISPALTESDPDKVRRATARAMQYLIDAQAVVVPLAGLPRLTAMKPSVEGFQPHPSVANTRWDVISIR